MLRLGVLLILVFTSCAAARLLRDIDPSRYQVWVAQYPSGIRLRFVSEVLAELLEDLHHALGFTSLHVVAHSMGGLVTRGAMLKISDHDSGVNIASYITLASPLGGHDAAAGAKSSADAVPAWIDMAGDSAFNKSLRKPLKPKVPYHLVYTTGHSGLPDAQATDGVVATSSQLVSWARNDALDQKGFALEHTEVLHDAAAIAYVMKLLDAANGTQDGKQSHPPQ